MIAQLKKLPRGLVATYDRIWRRINAEDSDPTERQWALKTLTCVLYAIVPLNDKQILASTSTNSTSLISGQKFQASGIEYLIRACANFVVRDEQMNVIRFVHFSAQEFIREKLGSITEYNGYLADVCFAALADGSYSVPTMSVNRPLRSSGSNPIPNSIRGSIYQYAARYWPEHARSWDKINSHRSRLIQQFLLNDNRFHSWLRYIVRFDRNHKRDGNYRSFPRTSFQIISYFNLPIILKHLIENNSCLDWKASLSIAALKTHQEIARILIKVGTDMDAVSEDFDHPLISAIKGESEEMVTLILATGVDIDAPPREQSQTALTVAVLMKSEIIVSHLLKAGADVNSERGLWGTALFAAVYSQSEKMVKLLLDAGAHLDTPRDDHQTLLMLAVEEGSEEVIRLLLDAGADIDAPGPLSKSPLTAAVLAASPGKVRLLIDAGADTNSQRGLWGTPLIAAVTSNSEEMVTMLLDAGADINTRQGDWGDPLSAAVVKDLSEMVMFLLDAGADINGQGAGPWGTAFLLAVENDLWEMAKLLLSAGANVHVEWRNVATPLRAAIGNQSKAMVSLILATGFNPNARTSQRTFETPLLAATPQPPRVNGFFSYFGW